MLALIVAYTNNRVIGNKGCIPWRLPNEMKRFVELTTGNIVVMGRRTFEEIGKPLPNRFNIIVSNTVKVESENCITVSSLRKALEFCENELPERDIFISGGEALYKEAIPLVEKMYVTIIDTEIEGDAFFPSFDDNDYNVEIVNEYYEELHYTYLTYTRK